jgi:adenylate cyclase
MCAIISEEGGIIDKVQGDATSPSGAPARAYDHSIGACRAALRMDREMVRLREEFRARETGAVHADRDQLRPDGGRQHGLERKTMDYTIMGDAVNLASRLVGATKLYGT